MAFSSFLYSAGEIELSAADHKTVKINKNFLERFGLRLMGIPHLGLRGRAWAILRELKDEKRKKILDAGSGPGLYALHLAKKGHSVIGVDIDTEKVKLSTGIAQRTGNTAEFIVGDLCALPFSDHSFEIIVCSDVIEHIPSDKKALQEMARVLKPEGKLILTSTGNNLFTKKLQRTFEHCRPGYEREDFEKLIEGTGLALMKVRPLFSLLGKAAWLANRRLSKHQKFSALLFYPLFWMYLIEYTAGVDYRPFNRLFVAIKKNN